MHHILLNSSPILPPRSPAHHHDTFRPVPDARRSLKPHAIISLSLLTRHMHRRTPMTPARAPSASASTPGSTGRAAWPSLGWRSTRCLSPRTTPVPSCLRRRPYPAPACRAHAPPRRHAAMQVCQSCSLENLACCLPRGRRCSCATMPPSVKPTSSRSAASATASREARLAKQVCPLVGRPLSCPPYRCSSGSKQYNRTSRPMASPWTMSSGRGHMSHIQRRPCLAA